MAIFTTSACCFPGGSWQQSVSRHQPATLAALQTDANDRETRSQFEKWTLSCFRKLFSDYESIFILWGLSDYQLTVCVAGWGDVWGDICVGVGGVGGGVWVSGTTLSGGWNALAYTNCSWHRLTYSLIVEGHSPRSLLRSAFNTFVQFWNRNQKN